MLANEDGYGGTYQIFCGYVNRGKVELSNPARQILVEQSSKGIAITTAESDAMIEYALCCRRSTSQTDAVHRPGIISLSSKKASSSRRKASWPLSTLSRLSTAASLLCAPSVQSRASTINTRTTTRSSSKTCVRLAHRSSEFLLTLLTRSWEVQHSLRTELALPYCYLPRPVCARGLPRQLVAATSAVEGRQKAKPELQAWIDDPLLTGTRQQHSPIQDTSRSTAAPRPNVFTSGGAEVGPAEGESAEDEELKAFEEHE